MAILPVNKLTSALPEWKNDTDPALSADNLISVNAGIKLNANTINQNIDNINDLQFFYTILFHRLLLRPFFRLLRLVAVTVAIAVTVAVTAILTAVAVAVPEGFQHIVENNTKEAGFIATQTVDGIVDVASGGIILTDHQQGCIHLIRKDFRIGEHAHGGRIHDDKIKHTQLFQHFRCGIAGNQLRRAAVIARCKQHIQANLLVAHHAFH